MNTEKKKAILIIAEGIWKNGEIKDGHGVLVPSDIGKPCNYTIASDYLIDECDYTHYDLVWINRGKTVSIKFYRGEELGATHIDESHFVIEYIVNISPDSSNYGEINE